jgi:hypothetical protein
MSMYHECQTDLKCAKHLISALNEMGFPTEYSEQPLPLYGYHGDKRQQTANIVIRRANIGAASNDVGFALQPDGTYAAIISGFDSVKFNQTWLGQLRAGYVEHWQIASQRARGRVFLGKEKVGDHVRLSFGVR